MTVHVAKFESLDWTTPKLPPDLAPELREQAAAVRRKGLAAGEGGFFASQVEMPPGQVTVPHSHDHAELMVVLDGSMRFDDGTATVELERNDAATISAGHVYGFTVGPDGVRFLLIRTGQAVSTIAPSDAAGGDG
jgi:mannose-6-phosphate isomerase-like protein (cupin superfamily)